MVWQEEMLVSSVYPRIKLVIFTTSALLDEPVEQPAYQNNVGIYNELRAELEYQHKRLDEARDAAFTEASRGKNDE